MATEKNAEIKKEPTFEQAMARLEQIVRALENGNVPLEDLISLFDEGTALVKLCTKKLQTAEEKITVLKGGNGTLTEEEFEEK